MMAGTVNPHKDIRVTRVVEGAEAHRTTEVDGEIERVVAHVMMVNGKVEGAVVHVSMAVDGKVEADVEGAVVIDGKVGGAVAHRIITGIIVVTGTDYWQSFLTEEDF